MMLNVHDLVNTVTKKPAELEVRIGDVAEGSNLQCSVGKVELRGSCIVLTPGDDDVWEDEIVASAQLAEHLWPTEEEPDDEDLVSTRCRPRRGSCRGSE